LESKLLEGNLIIAVEAVQRTPSQNVPTQQPEPPDYGQPATRLPLRVLPSDLGDSM